MGHLNHGSSTANICETLMPKSDFSQNPRKDKKKIVLRYTNETDIYLTERKYIRTFMKNKILVLEVLRWK
jgi:hypothetical protein